MSMLTVKSFSESKRLKHLDFLISTWSMECLEIANFAHRSEWYPLSTKYQKIAVIWTVCFTVFLARRHVTSLSLRQSEYSKRRWPAHDASTHKSVKKPRSIWCLHSRRGRPRMWTVVTPWDRSVMDPFGDNTLTVPPLIITLATYLRVVEGRSQTYKKLYSTLI